MKNTIIIYQGKDGDIQFKADLHKEAIWATQAQIVDLFEIDQSVVSRHVRNIFKDGEISEKSNMQKMHIANSDKLVTFYSLDVILSIGYRANSSTAINFRKWATKTLKEHITEGYTINKKVLSKNYEEFLQAVETLKKVLPFKSQVLTTDNTLDLVKLFAKTWFALDSYDKSNLIIKKVTKKNVKFDATELNSAVQEFKKELIKKGQATEIFAQDRNRDSLEGIVGNVMQIFDDKQLCESLEEKAAHLLYFVVKNYPFVDGNKRTGAFAFIWFLEKYKILDISKLSPEALTSLTLLVAESDPKQKENMVKLIMKIIEK